VISESAFDFYEAKKYMQALELFGETDTPAGSFYAAQCLLAMGQTNAAMRRLEKVASMQTDYSDSAKWYLGLAAIKLGKKEEAVTHLNTISDNIIYEDRVKSLLAMLE
ncbi:MAG: tetratricopeptide repeat protein, partial [Cyclobacteriaceae bacterium]